MLRVLTVAYTARTVIVDKQSDLWHYNRTIDNVLYTDRVKTTTQFISSRGSRRVYVGPQYEGP